MTKVGGKKQTHTHKTVGKSFFSNKNLAIPPPPPAPPQKKNQPNFQFQKNPKNKKKNPPNLSPKKKKKNISGLYWGSRRYLRKP
jgi:hypothetical protein